MVSRVGNDFVARAMAVVAGIPRGRVLSYSEVARLAGNARAARAVGRIMSANFDPRVPCHRVVRSDGTLGGYNQGLRRKEEILKREGVTISRGIVML